MTIASSERADGSAGSIFRPGENCWRVATADRIGLIVDAADYFRTLRAVMIAAKRELLLIGWDFDFEIEMLPGDSDDEGVAWDGYPNRLGDFLDAVVARAPDLQVYLLKWNGAALLAPGRILPTLAVYAFASDRIRFALDGHHPFGACHHQKIVVADDDFAFCGGIDVTEGRWDTTAHKPDDTRRHDKSGSTMEPWHDATMALTGPAAKALAELSRRRWFRATGDEIERPDGPGRLDWPEGLDVAVEAVQVAIARTEPPYDGDDLIDEIEHLYLDAISAARDWIYIESQYFAAESVCAALETRLSERDGPEIVVINPQAARSGFEDAAMHVQRGRMIERLQKADPGGRFGIFHPVNAAGEPIYVHAKIFIVDNRLLRIGSSNIDDRSMGFDTECDVAFENGLEAKSAIGAFRDRLLAEHLDATPETVADEHRQTNSLIATISTLNPETGRRLCRIEQLEEDMVGTFLADTRLLDPRYLPGATTAAGRGLRPRHLGIAAAAAIGLGLLGLLAYRQLRRLRDASDRG